MVCRGTVKNGVVELEAGAALPDGTRVEVRAVMQEHSGSEDDRPLRDYARLARKTGLPSDLSVQHDHYIHGTAKR